MRKNILPLKSAKPIEQQSDGTWIIRYAIQPIGRTDSEGNEPVSYTHLTLPTTERV